MVPPIALAAVAHLDADGSEDASDDDRGESSTGIYGKCAVMAITQALRPYPATADDADGVSRAMALR